MRKILSLILVAVMIISAFATLTVSAEETGTEGNWEVHIDAFEESKLNAGEPVFQPLPGYKYTDDGFEIVPAVYNNVQAKFTAISKTKYSTKDFSIKVRLDEYTMGGDNWVSFSFWSEKHGLAQGSTNSDGSFGYGWYSLVRDANDELGVKGDNKLEIMEVYNSGTKELPGGMVTMTTNEFEPIVDENGVQYLEFKVVNYEIFINGAKLGLNECKALRSAFKSDGNLAYFGISVKNGESNVPVKFTIMEVDGVKPTGSDSAEPVYYAERQYGDMIDASTIPAGTPGVLFDATFTAQNVKVPSTSKCLVDLTENDTFKITAYDYLGSIGFSVKDDYSVDIKDFPYIAIVLKNYCTCEQEEGYSMAENCYGDELTNFYYCAGSVIAPDDEHKFKMGGDNMIDISPEGSEDYYTMFWVKVDTTEFEEVAARIHSLRFDIAYTKGGQEFEIMYAGYFANAEDIASFATAKGYALTVEDLVGEEGTDDPSDPNGGTTGGTPVETEPATAPIEDGEEETTKKEKTTTSKVEDNKSEDKKGCGSVVGGAIAVIVAASVAGIVTFKKRRED